MSHVSDSKCGLLNFAEPARNLDPEIAFQTAAERCRMKALRRNDSRNSITGPQRVDFHSRSPYNITDPLRHVCVAFKNPIKTHRMDVIKRCIQLKQQGESRSEWHRPLVLFPIPIKPRCFGTFNL